MEFTDSAQGRYLEPHNCYPYENSQKCNPVQNAAALKVFKVRNLSDIRRKWITKGYYDKDWQECPLNV